jgi:hypothetical protein
MAKTYRRRRHRRANRTRRGGVKHSAAHSASAHSASRDTLAPAASAHSASRDPLASAASAASASRDTLAPALGHTIDMDAIKRRVLEIAAQGATHASASKPKKTISKEEADRKRFNKIMKGTLKHSSKKSAFKGAVIGDPQAARERGY